MCGSFDVVGTCVRSKLSAVAQFPRESGLTRVPRALAENGSWSGLSGAIPPSCDLVIQNFKRLRRSDISLHLGTNYHFHHLYTYLAGLPIEITTPSRTIGVDTLSPPLGRAFDRRLSGL